MGALSILNLKTFYLEMVKNFVLHGLGSLSISDFGTTLKLCKVWDLELWQVWGVKIIPGSIPIKHTTTNF